MVREEIGEQTGQRRRRVPALPPEDRRQALIAATIPLLREHGTAVSTRAIADAAGVAEGTIFGVFKDKESLLRAAVIASFDPASLIAQLQQIDPADDLRRRLVQAVRLVRAHVSSHGNIFHTIRGPLFQDRSGLVEIMSSRFLILGALTTLVEPDAHRLRRSPAIAARLVLSLVGSPRNAFTPFDETLDDDDVVSIVLDGLLIPDATGRRTRTEES